MKKSVIILIVLISLLMGNISKAQNVGIGNTSFTPHASAGLEIQFTNKGLLIPRVALTSVNDVTTIPSPATSLLVYNNGTGGLTPAGFYYWNGSQWQMIGSGGASCNTLEQAYNCGGNGAGRVINTNYGRVEMKMASSATNTEALYVESNKGTQSAPTAGIQINQNQHGVALQVGTFLGANLYNAIEATNNTTNTSTSYIPAGVAGFCSSSGKGAGVWAEYDGTNTGSFGLYAKASGNNFGAIMVSPYVGADIEVTNASGIALQVVSAGASYTNPASLIRGLVQMDISDNIDCQTVIFNNLAFEPTFAPSVPGFGMLGTSSTPWFQGYAVAWNAPSRRDLKRNITYIDNDIENLFIQDIKNLKPTIYKYKNEKDDFDSNNAAKTRYNAHIGFIIDELPDYVQDNTFSAVNIYNLSTLALIGAKYAIEQVEELQSQPITTFGIAQMNGQNEVRINFDNDFISSKNNSESPVITITAAAPGEYYIKAIDNNGFTVASTNPTFQFHWVAYAKRQVKEQNTVNNIDPQLMSWLRVDTAKKEQMRQWGMSLKQPEPLKLLGDRSVINATSPRMKK
ncbi:MAG: tail fiber domain-containing protein [Bacteroidales bacterium]|nr:tail fiber domain-containing protein [Bacteroidales bacterium]